MDSIYDLSLEVACRGTPGGLVKNLAKKISDAGCVSYSLC